MKAQLPRIGYLLASMIIALLPACGGGGGGGGSEAPAQASPSAVNLQQQEDAPYQVTLFGVAGEDSFAVALNDSGQVALNSGLSAYLWSDGRLKRLSRGATALDISAGGEVVGWLEEGNTTRAFVHSGILELFDFPEGPSKAYGIDGLGRVVGRFTIDIEQAFLDGAAGTETLLPDVNGYATGLNDAGQVLIKEVKGNAIRALLLEVDGSLVELGTLGGSSSQSQDINARGEVVGWSQSADGNYRAFLWRNGSMTDLSEPEWTYSSAVAINDEGQVLIKAAAGAENRIYLWEDGELTDLDHFGLEYAVVTDMNNQGEIVGWTVGQDNTFQAFLASPR